MPGISNKPLSADDWAVACKHLARKDRVMRRLVPLYAREMLRREADGFALLMRSVVWQQLSETSARQLWKRLMAVPGATTPKGLLALSDEAAKAMRLPQRKLGYLRDLAAWFVQEPKDALSWVHMDDDAVIEQLMAQRGLARWGAEMFLLFHLGRPNVLAIDDAALLQGISDHYFSGEAVSRSDAREVAQAWQPWASVAAWLIWRSQNAMPLGQDAD
ncbi:DNA-3-methyladenine glycosylase 2 family protein [Comamonas piscis]|uniref:DNA-3-methyladenine glycosylase II n=1 Tax=Comamonas piscis TaxID=1562974 RepID=A0A7G5EGR0_9BURK|nr:DNA-3-methyladenine glycosylase 2 family protein [Comamonas piscis]QMV73185.1 DNA-3-methyladenine glycosylase 2 family protein [Comamonas piscis]WSO35975.1 DNA-3-methyladenine glycosylase 2 family protein [Comamonas piscis]